MSAPFDVVALIGSLRRESYTRRLVHGLAAIASNRLSLEVVEIGGLALYNQDEELHPSSAWISFRERVGRADAVLFATPEYNRSVPGALKNAVDVGSRPYGKSVWAGKPCAIVTISIGALGGFGANHHLRQSLVSLDMPTLQQPEMYLGQAQNLIDATGRFGDADTEAYCRRFLVTFEGWIARHHGQRIAIEGSQGISPSDRIR